MTRYSVSGILTPDATIADTGEPVGVDVYGQDYYSWTNEDGTWYLSVQLVYGPDDFQWIISREVGSVPRNTPAWLYRGANPVGVYSPKTPATGIASVAEYTPVAAVVTNILLGSTPEACSILNSRIVRGPL